MSLTERLEAASGRFAARRHRQPIRTLLLAVLITLAGGYFASRLRLSADLTELLPRSFQSVRDIDKLRVRYGGMGYITVVGLGAEPEKLRQFADEIAPELEKLPETRFVDFKRSDRFFEDRSFYYLEPPDLVSIRDRISGRIRYEKTTRNPLYISLEDEVAPPSLDFSDIEKKYQGAGNRRLAGRGETYYLDPQERMIVLLVKPNGNSADLGYSKRAVSQVEQFLASRDYSQYGPGFRTAVTGTYKKKIDQQQEITSDLARSSMVTLLLLLLYLAFHFRSVLAVIFTLTPVAAGLAWTYGFVGLVYGQVNLLTAFLGAILGGLSVEHGIHLLGRYSALRGEGKDPEEAVRDAFAHTGFSAIISSTVAALTFLSLAISEFRAFREFGVIAAAGMLVSITVYFLLLPGLLGLSERLGLRPRTERGVDARNSELARWLPRHYRGFAVAVAILVAGLTAAVPGVRFNYDFSALDDVTLPSVQLDKKIDKILGYSQTPVVVLTDTPEMEREAAQKLRERQRERGEKSTVDFVLGLEDLVPREQDEKRELMREIGAQLKKIDPASLEPDARAQYERAERFARAEPFTQADLPAPVRRQFLGADGKQGGFLLVFASVSLGDAQGVRRLAREVRGLELASGAKVSAAGEAMVLVDILEMVIRESPRILAAAIVSVLLAMWLTLGNFKTALLCLSPTLLSIITLVGLMAVTGTPFNYLNIVVVPVLVGTTVDAGVHLVSRFRET
ncbi:MAG TPA: MMPL family transporter, partial [Myxococcaceae bacterium]|nr:MMPL family transporter [Myxococcaceae bacterium]